MDLSGLILDLRMHLPISNILFRLLLLRGAKARQGWNYTFFDDYIH